jgi:hypothetical protein
MSSMLFDTRPTDLASYPAARTTARIDPALTLRTE